MSMFYSSSLANRSCFVRILKAPAAVCRSHIDNRSVGAKKKSSNHGQDCPEGPCYFSNFVTVIHIESPTIHVQRFDLVFPGLLGSLHRILDSLSHKKLIVITREIAIVLMAQCTALPSISFDQFADNACVQNPSGWPGYEKNGLIGGLVLSLIAIRRFLVTSVYSPSPACFNNQFEYSLSPLRDLRAVIHRWPAAGG
jgi:hypothetical protein